MESCKKTRIHEKSTNSFILAALVFSFVILGITGNSWATQIHDRPEGLFAHQMAHVFFMTSMIFLVYWLRKNRFVKQKGWRLIQYSGILFALWNIDAMLVHCIDEMLDTSFFIGSQVNWSKKLIIKDHPWLIIYYVGRMDHLLCVPAILFLYFGIKQLHEEGQPLVINED